MKDENPVTALDHLLQRNRSWALRTEVERPGFFAALAKQQSPEYLWIGCADSRVPANEIIDLPPGEVFVHRNVANVVAHADLNCLTVLQFAVDILQVKHIIVVGHYGCSGVHAALERKRVGLADNWLQHVRDVAHDHRHELSAIEHDEARADRLCELNAIEQASNVCETTIVRDAWLRGQELQVHAWVYGLKDGRVRDLDFCVGSAAEFTRRRENGASRKVSKV
ncbi:MAG: carbonate dehydratase [Nevskia sp.]|nr:carbonate dehydratase [Nevskia sp.]